MYANSCPALTILAESTSSQSRIEEPSIWPGGGILSEFHVVANGIDNHVADVATYGAISSGPLSNLTNSRISTGIAKNGVAVEVRMWDGGEPGRGTDIVYVKLDGVEILGPNGQYLDQGNMQYHSNCRGPG